MASPDLAARLNAARALRAVREEQLNQLEDSALYSWLVRAAVGWNVTPQLPLATPVLRLAVQSCGDSVTAFDFPPIAALGTVSKAVPTSLVFVWF